MYLLLMTRTSCRRRIMLSARELRSTRILPLDGDGDGMRCWRSWRRSHGRSVLGLLGFPSPVEDGASSPVCVI
jgi:hypothetical protein